MGSQEYEPGMLRLSHKFRVEKISAFVLKYELKSKSKSAPVLN
jgi:hypothetical protein